MSNLVLSKENLKIDEAFENIVGELHSTWCESGDFYSVMVEKSIGEGLSIIITIEDYDCSNCQNKDCTLKDTDKLYDECMYATSYYLTSKIAIRYKVDIVKKNDVDTVVLDEFYSKNLISEDNASDYDALFELLSDVKVKIDKGDYK